VPADIGEITKRKISLLSNLRPKLEERARNQRDGGCGD
jgi:hypothetical protein